MRRAFPLPPEKPMRPASRSSRTSSAAAHWARRLRTRTPVRSPAPMSRSTRSFATAASCASTCSRRWSRSRLCWRAGFHPRLARAPRVSVVTTTGGGAASVVDRLGLHGIELGPMNDLTMTATHQTYGDTLQHAAGWNRLRRRARCRRLLRPVSSRARGAADPERQTLDEAARRLPHAARRALARAARRRGRRRLSHARSLRRCLRRLLRLARAKRDRATEPELDRAPSPKLLRASLGIPARGAGGGDGPRLCALGALPGGGEGDSTSSTRRKSAAWRSMCAITSS